MTVVSYPNIVETFKRSLSEILLTFFNNGMHPISGINLQFPSAEFVFEKKQLDTLTGLTISIIGEDLNTEEVYKVNDPIDPRKHAVESRAKVTRRVFIACPYDGGDPTKNRRAVDQAWGLLYAVFAGNWSLFSAKNIIFPKLTAVPEDLFETPTLVEASGTLDCEIRYSFSRYN